MTGFYWLASYPRSGNTWLRLALASLQAGGRTVDFETDSTPFPLLSYRVLFDKLLEIDSSSLTPDESERLRPRAFERLAQTADTPLIRKVHDAWTLTSSGEPLFPPAFTLGAIYIVRDPRDVAVSLAAYMGFDIDEAVRRMNDPATCLSGNRDRLETHFRQQLGSWSSHVDSWLDAPGIRTILIRYEDMLANPAAALETAATFMGWRPSAAAVAAAARATQFATLQQTEARQGFLEKPATAARFFRRGIAGGWRDALNARQSASIERDHQRVMKRLGYA